LVEAYWLPDLPQSVRAVHHCAAISFPDSSKIALARGRQAGAPGRALDEWSNPGNRRPDESDGRDQSLPAGSAPGDGDHRHGGPLAVLRAASVRRSVLAEAQGLGVRGSGPRWKLLLQAAQDPAVVLRQHRVPSRSPSEPAYSELQPGELPPGRSAVSAREADHAPLQPAIIHLPSLGRTAWQADRLPPPARASPTTGRSLPIVVLSTPVPTENSIRPFVAWF